MPIHGAVMKLFVIVLLERDLDDCIILCVSFFGNSLEVAVCSPT